VNHVSRAATLLVVASIIGAYIPLSKLSSSSCVPVNGGGCTPGPAVPQSPGPYMGVRCVWEWNRLGFDAGFAYALTHVTEPLGRDLVFAGISSASMLWHVKSRKEVRFPPYLLLGISYVGRGSGTYDAASAAQWAVKFGAGGHWRISKKWALRIQVEDDAYVWGEGELPQHIMVLSFGVVPGRGGGTER